MPATTTQPRKQLYRKAAITAVVLAAVSAAGYSAWYKLVRDQVIECRIDLGVVSFDLPDIGQRMYCPEKSGPGPASS